MDDMHKKIRTRITKVKLAKIRSDNPELSGRQAKYILRSYAVMDEIDEEANEEYGRYLTWLYEQFRAWDKERIE